jgi:hypothetical protein
MIVWQNGKMTMRFSAPPVFHAFLLAAICILLMLSSFLILPHSDRIAEDRCATNHGAVKMVVAHEHQEDSSILLSVHTNRIVDIFSVPGFDRIIQTSSRTISPRLPPPKI